MVKQIVRDPLFLQQKSKPATEADKQVIKTPVVRSGKQPTLGYQPDVWKKWE